MQRFRVIQERPDTLREVFAHLFRNRTSYHNFEALKDVSFTIGDGEVVGVVGRNGSGKSTILKIIAGVYRPTAGAVKVFRQGGRTDRAGRGISPGPDRPGKHSAERTAAGPFEA